MEEHPGDTLGKRFLTFWGSVAVILAFGVLVYFVKSFFGPGDGDEIDRGAAKFREDRLALVVKEQETEASKYALDKAKNTVTIPTTAAIPYAAAILAQQKAEKSKTAVPGAIPPAAATPGSGAHDPNESKFLGK